MINLTDNQFSSVKFWETPLSEYLPKPEDVELFDQNGYDLTRIEILFAGVNNVTLLSHRPHRHALKTDWFTQDTTLEGCILNHSLLFERKAYGGEALGQLYKWADEYPIFNKIIAIRSKWGLDFSMDYVDRKGNTLEILHWEWDSFNLDEINDIKTEVEPILLAIDWDDAAKSILNRKNEWHKLPFFEQSDWKCNFFGITKERFKMVIWD